MDVVLIEDLDRIADAQKLFIKLRELNALINKSEQVTNKKVTFIYALGNDVFPRGEDQTKFFDLIIPVVPVVHYSNSENIFAERIKKYEDIEINKEFIQNISLYVDDIRIINNVFNEFTVYKQKLKIEDKNDINKLLAILIYKSTYPESYSGLLKREGILHHILYNKRKYIEDLNKDIESELEGLKKKIEAVHREHLKNKNEINKIAIYEIIRKLRLQYNYDVTYMKIDGINILEVDLEKLQLSEKTKIYSNNASYKINFTEIDREISYSERLTNLELKEEKEVEKIRNKIKELESLKSKNTHLKISQIIQTAREIVKEDLEKFKNKNDNEDKRKKIGNEIDMLFYLLRKGYIAEDYDMFISEINSEELDSKALEYLKALKRRECLEFDYEITRSKILRMLGRIDKEDFEEDAILNYELLKYFLLTPGPLADDFFKKLRDERKKTIDFIKFSVEEFLNFDKKEEDKNYIEKFVTNLYGVWENMWEYIEESDVFLEEDKNKFFYLIIKYVSIEELEKNENIKNSLEKKSNFTLECLKYEIPNEKISSILNKLDIKFKNLRFYEKVDIALTEEKDLIFEQIIEGNYYELNFHNIEEIFKYKNIKISDLKNKNYTEIMSSGYEKLIKYVENNFEEYFDNVLEKIMETNREEEVEILYKIARSDKLENESKIKFLLNQKENLENLDLANEQLEENLVSEKKIKVSWANIFYYYQKRCNGEIDEVLSEYLNTPEIYTKLEMLPDLQDELDELDEKLQKDICENKNIGTKALESYVKKFNWKLDSYKLENISDEKLELMVEEGIVEITPNYIRDLKTRENNLYINLIIKNFETFIQNEKTYNLALHDYEKIFVAEENIENKKKLIPTIEFLIEMGQEEASGEFLDKLWNTKEVRPEIKSDMLISSLIENKIIELSSENIVFLKDKSMGNEFNYVIELCMENLDDFLKNPVNYGLSEEDYIELVEYHGPNSDFLIGLVEGIKSKFNDFSSDFFEKLYKVIIKEDERRFPSNFILDVLKIGYKELSEYKISIMLNYIMVFSEEDLKEIFDGLSDEYKNILRGPRQTRIDKTELNLKLVEALKEKDIISSFSIDSEGKIRINKKRKQTL